jgi:phospholipid/cholesterol/gamma-HCH transport system substrate-binding protein
LVRRRRGPARIIVIAALLAAVAVVGFVVLRGGQTYSVTARFASASQLVKGDRVDVAGVSVGSVADIGLTDDGQAAVELKIDDPAYAPLRTGTTMVVRQASLSGVASRYVELHLPPGSGGPTIPDGGVVGTEDTTSTVDLDQLFATFDGRTRRALSRFIRGSASQYRGAGLEANAGWRYLDPSLAANRRLLEEVDRDRPLFARFVTNSSRLVTDLAQRRGNLAGLVDHLATTTTAIGARRRQLGSAIDQLPDFMRQANTTFVDLRSTLDDLDPLVKESKPVARKLGPFLSQLRPLARDARPTLRDLSQLISTPGDHNDLIELTRQLPALRSIAVGPVQRNGDSREGALPASTRALQASTPEFATARPYAPDLTGWFDDFGHSGVYDALGGGSRAAINVNAFANINGVLQPIPLELRQQAFASLAALGQRSRCPGAIERGATWKPSPDFPCDERQQPQGP